MKDIIGYEGLYSVSDDGKIWSNKKYRHNGIFLKQHKSTNGYMLVGLTKDKKRKTYSVHRLVGLAYISNKELLPEINHIDGDKTNNHVLNLEWVTSSYNQKHAISNGLQTFSEKHRLAAIETCRKNGKANKGKQNKKLWKLSFEQAQDIRLRHSNGESMRSIAINFCVDKGTISSIIKGKRYV